MHPLRTFGRWLLRRGLLDRGSRLGRFMGACTRRSTRSSWRATPSRAATARSSRRSATSSPAGWRRRISRVPERIAPGDPPDGQRLLRSAFTRYSIPRRPAGAAAGEPRDRPARTDPPAARDLRGARRRDDHRRGARAASVPDSPPAGAEGGRAARGAGAGPARRALARDHHPLADGALGPGPDPLARHDLDDPFPEVLRVLSDEELAALVAMFEPSAGVDHRAPGTGRTCTSGCTTSSTCSGCSTSTRDLFEPPFTPSRSSRSSRA